VFLKAVGKKKTLSLLLAPTWFTMAFCNASPLPSLLHLHVLPGCFPMGHKEFGNPWLEQDERTMITYIVFKSCILLAIRNILIEQCQKYDNPP
jgi:hypothetical protein